MRVIPRTIAGRVMLAGAASVVAAVATFAVVLPLALSAPLPGDATSAGARIMASVVLAAVVGTLAAVLASLGVARMLASEIEALTDRSATGMFSRAGWSVDGATVEVERLTAALRRMSSIAAARYATAEAERDRSATLLREMADAVLIVDARDAISLANPSAERLLGRVGAAGMRVLDVVREHELLDAVDRARTEGAATAEVERADPRRSLRVVTRLLPGGDVLLVVQDLTSVRRLETVRRDFVANVSHELRTPIASLKAMAEALEGGALDDPAVSRDFVSRMHREIDELAQLVSELLTLARVESGDEQMRRRPVRPAEILAAAAARLRPLAVRAGVALEVAGTDGVTPVLADPERIGQVLSNLVHNAVKFTPAGGRVTLAAEPTAGGARFAVRDTGVGLARDELDRVFERFYKSERSRAGGGTGLGLAIARHIVVAHGGTIAAESDGPGRGATFSFTLPAALEPAP